MGNLVSVNLAVVRTAAWAGEMGRTGIDKRPVSGRVKVGRLGVEGDTVVDTRHHGGVDQAVYAYATEDAAWWAEELARDVPPGRFGENLTTSGLDVTNAVIGERWRVGDAELEVSCPRIPCRVFAGFWDVKGLIKRFIAEGRPGSYLRVVTEGGLAAGDPVEVTHRPGHGVTIGEVFGALTNRPELLPRLLEAPELPSESHDLARRRVGIKVDD